MNLAKNRMQIGSVVSEEMRVKVSKFSPTASYYIDIENYCCSEIFSKLSQKFKYHRK